MSERSTEEIPDRGNRWVAAQVILQIVALVASPLEFVGFGRAYVPGHPLVAVVAGVGLMIGAVIIVRRAYRILGKSTTASPTPLDEGEFVDGGIYSSIRHPMYLAVIMGLAGWAVAWGTISGLVITGVGLVFFTFKARHEERLLVERYPEYQDYRKRVTARFVPGLW